MSLLRFAFHSLLLQSTLLGAATLVRAQDRGAALRGSDLHAPSAPREPSADDAASSPRVRRRREPSASGPAAAPGAPAASSDPTVRQADSAQRLTKPRQRRRADFDGADWDAPEEVKQDPSELAGSFHLGAELTLVGFELLRLKIDGFTSVGQERTTGSFGVGEGAGLGVVVGLGLSHNIVLNARVTFADSAHSYAGGAVDHKLRFQITPSLEYAFSDASDSLRPFAGICTGMFTGESMAGPLPISEVSFLLAGQAGLHIFPSAHVSLDPALLFGYRVGWASAEMGGPSGAGADYSVDGLYLLLSFGVSYWS